MAHQPIKFGDGSANIGGNPQKERGSDAFGEAVEPLPPGLRPTAIDLKKDQALTVTWSDGRVSVYPVGYLRRWSPSAEATQLRKQQAQNPLTVLPASASANSDQPFSALNAELVGHYALRIAFSDGHDTGLYTWPYLRQIDPANHDSPPRPPQ